jgi:small subunit ribosomal protein S16
MTVRIRLARFGRRVSVCCVFVCRRRVQKKVFSLRPPPIPHLFHHPPLKKKNNQNLPFYRIFVADSRAPRDGKHLEVLGHYDPAPGKDGHKHLALDVGRVRAWLAVGAQPSKPVAALLGRAGLAPPPPRVAPEKTMARGVKNPDKKTSGRGGGGGGEA